MSIYTIRSGGTAHPEDSFLQYFTDVVVASGVKDLSSDNNLKITEKGGGTDMSVDIAAGRAMIKGSTSNLYPVRNTATYNLAIAGNASGNPRIDAIVVYIDLAASPDSTASNVAKFLRVGGTPAGSPVAPDDSAIQTAVGGSNPFLRLADVRVDNGETQILNADITDQRVRTKLRTGSNRFNLLSGAATVTPDFSIYNIQEITLDRATTIIGTPTGVSNDEAIVINLKEDGVGGRAVTWFANIDWYGGEPTLTPTASRTDSFGFIKRSTGRWDGYVLGQDKPA